MAKSFSASVGQWASQSEARIQAVYRRSVELLSEEMTRTRGNGGRMPYLTGNLARSLLASTESMPKTSEVLSAGSNVGAVTATLRLDQVIFLGFQAVYARRVNSGFVGADSLGRSYNQSGSYFLEGAIAEWPQIVSKAAAEIQGSVDRG